MKIRDRNVASPKVDKYLKMASLAQYLWLLTESNAVQTSTNIPGRDIWLNSQFWGNFGDYFLPTPRTYARNET